MSQDNLKINREILAQNVAKLRLAHNLKREESSLFFDFDNSYISKLEKGRINIQLKNDNCC